VLISFFQWSFIFSSTSVLYFEHLFISNLLKLDSMELSLPLQFLQLFPVVSSVKVLSNWAKSPKKAVCRSIFLTNIFDNMHCILSAELPKMHSFRRFFWRFCQTGKQLEVPASIARNNLSSDFSDWICNFVSNVIIYKVYVVLLLRMTC